MHGSAVLCTCFSAVLTICSTQAWAAEKDIRRAYDEARQCFVANGHVYASFKGTGDRANTHLFEMKAKQSFDLSYFYGNMLHLSHKQVANDLDKTSNNELPRLARDAGYLTAVAKSCKSAGLM